MKKILFFFTLFISFFVFDHVDALTLNVHYDSSYTNSIVANTPISDIDSTLIPFVELNMDDYYITLLPRFDNTVNNVPSSIRINIYQKLEGKIPVIETYLRSGYNTAIKLSQVNSLDGDGHATGFNNFGYYTMFYTFQATDNATGGSMEHLIELLQSWLLNPTYHATNQNSPDIVEISNVITNDTGNFLNVAYAAREGLPYYFNFEPRISYSTNWQNYNAKFNVIYDNENYLYDFTYIFPTYKDFVELNTYYPPTTFDYGDGQYAFTSNQIVINDLSGNAETIVKCPQNTDFINDFCYTNRFSYHTTADMPDSQLNVSFDMLNAIPFYQDKYYVLTFRTHLVNNYLPTIASISSGSTSMPIHIVKTNIINNGLYTDIQVVLKASQSFGSNEPYAIRNISLIYPKISTSEPENYEDWYYGFYKVYKMSYFDNVPTTTELDHDYKNNDIDSVGNNDSNSSWFSKFKVNDRGLSNIVKAPITLFQSMRSTTCTDIVLPLPHFGNITLPCISFILNENVPTLLSIYQIIISGVICYYIGLNYFRIIKNSFTPDNDRIEVQDL